MLARVRASEAQSALLACWMSNSGVSRTIRRAMKTDYLNAKILSHRANLQRYATLLATQLTELEREYLHKRIEEERAEVASLEFARAAEAAQAKETVTVPNPLLLPTAGADGFLNFSQSGERPDR